MAEEQNTKQCRYCGKSLPVEAIFCYYCQRELITRPERPDVDAKKNSSDWIFGLIILVVLIVIILIITSK